MITLTDLQGELHVGALRDGGRCAERDVSLFILTNRSIRNEARKVLATRQYKWRVVTTDPCKADKV